MTNHIFSVAIHHQQRGVDGAYTVLSGNSAIAVSQTATRLIDELHKLYARRASKAYGKFASDTVNYPTSTNLQNYLEGTTDFEALTLALMATLAKQAQAKSASTGGHVFFAHFEREKAQYLLVAIVTDKLSAALTANQDLEDVKHLDVEGFRFAGRVGVTGWAAGEQRYIGFLKGKGAVSDYFKEFLGCDTTIQSRVETTSLVNALKTFADRQKFDAAQREMFMDKALSICDRDARDDRPVDFATLANELHPENPEALVEVLADPKLSLNDGFVADRRALKGLVNFKKKTANWSVEFERRALHAGKVRYNPEEKSITLMDVPEDMQRELGEEMRDG
ncbi:nucleoid-associated protein [Mesorhizobium tianshanense]|uniref:Nucleoid-associated protein n=1 Tax=Mesorhizobium tianshanense TaxID=39844 RepID=A0A562P7T5_9HYPH|nr:nucleoid-associated protein [Mesorhizobium tianshanense]TWI40046.1 nucleoid-associated protein [Mesorhizobium tianshanense]GLS40425.1 nucleoid-associated protein [Mesorhizobium tianshanense]